MHQLFYPMAKHKEHFQRYSWTSEVNYACYLIIKKVVILSVASDWKQTQNLCSRSTLQLIKLVNMLNLNKTTVGQCIQKTLVK